MISFDLSLKLVHECAGGLRAGFEIIATRSALGRVVAVPIYSKRANPSQNLSAMDGIAVDINSFSAIPAKLESTKFQRVNTGEAVPTRFNAVVKIEDILWEESTAVLQKHVEFFQNVRRVGEDFSSGSLLFAPGHRLDPQDLSLLLAAGCESVEVSRKPVVTFIPTGSELIPTLAQEQPGKVLESNSAMVAGLVESWGGEFRLSDPVADEYDPIRNAIRGALEGSDIIIVSAGTSMGTRDLTEEVLSAMGKVHFHGVAMTPAKPVVFAEIGNVPLLGLPGYPVAAYVACHYYLRPLVTALSGVSAAAEQQVLISTEDLAPRDMDTIYRVNVFDVDGRVYVRKISRGAGSIHSLSQMDGLMRVPASTKIAKRDAVRVDVVRNRASNTIAIRGSSDSLITKLFGLFHVALPGTRILHWDCSAEDALQSIIERNAHLAVIPTGSRDLFPTFANQLQEQMYRYRIFTRTVGLVMNEAKSGVDRITDLPKDLRVGVPDKNVALWNMVLQYEGRDLSYFQFAATIDDEDSVVSALEAGHWDAVFADIRFLRSGQTALGTAREHMDLVVSETYLQLPAIKKLIEALMSEEYAAAITSYRGCEARSRGLLQEAHDYSS